ncbi:MAG: hypothetical protein UU47_C0002G0051 [candidate division TM6 bacterium GW2011_GWE2_41_16]|nr:MAG: hypothetical protein UU47_C0002G0051 [candidate division TM6 bacterium GW2011_GWE2_41_16]
MHIKNVLPIVLVACIFASFSAVITKPVAQNSQLKITTSDQKPQQPLLDLLGICAITHDGSLKNIVQQTQQTWLRKSGTERWQMNASERLPSTIALPYFEKLGMVQKIVPSHKNYDYALVLGATTGTVRNRLAYLANLWQQGIRFTTLVLLGSERPLDTTTEPEASLNNIPQRGLPTRTNWQAPTTLPQTESTMMRMIFEQVEIPEDMRACQLVVVNSPQQITPEGKIKRATTADTLRDWLKMNPAPGLCLFVSNQPYVAYQHAVVESMLPQSFIVDTVGERIDNETANNINICFDCLARWLYQEYHNSKTGVSE